MAPPDPQYLHHICPHCGQVNIPGRQTCKHCRAPLGAIPTLPSMPSHDPSRESYMAILPHLPITILVLLATVLLIPFAIALVVARLYLGLLVLILPLKWMLVDRPDIPKTVTLTLSASALDFHHPDIHIRTTWHNVDYVTAHDWIVLHRPAATRVEYRNRSDAWFPQYHRERIISLQDFEPADITAIVDAVRRYAPNAQIRSVAPDVDMSAAPMPNADGVPTSAGNATTEDADIHR